MKDISNKVFLKTQEVLFLDKVKTPSQIAGIIAPEIYYVLKQYFDLSPSSYNAVIHVLKDGTIDVNFTFNAARILIKKENQY